jgi:cell division protein FtsB
MAEDELTELVNALRIREREAEIIGLAGWVGDHFRRAADAIESLRASLAQLEERNAELEEAVDKLQDGIRFIQLHQSKRRK